MCMKHMDDVLFWKMLWLELLKHEMLTQRWIYINHYISLGLFQITLEWILKAALSIWRKEQKHSKPSSTCCLSLALASTTSFTVRNMKLHCSLVCAVLKKNNLILKLFLCRKEVSSFLSGLTHGPHEKRSRSWWSSPARQPAGELWKASKGKLNAPWLFVSCMKAQSLWII